MPAEIKLCNITKTYQLGDMQQTVLKGLNLEVQTSELLAIMGASGSGKTTLMNIIGMLDNPTTGQYLIKDRDVTTLSEDDRAEVRNHAIGFVFQQFFLLPRLTILQNVGLPLYYRGCKETEIRERSMQVLKKVGLGDHVNYRPNQLSGGQQQRTAVARALVGKPTFILADEPTGALDTATGKIIMDLFIELNQTEKVTTIIVTHDPRIAAQCQRTVRIEDGRFLD
jgi:putative ABC transport system ATP-binding protein